MGNLLIMFCLVMAVQVGFSFLQFRNLKKVIVALKQRQRQGDLMTMGRFKALYSFKQGVVCILLISDSNQVIDFWEMRGRTVFTKPKRKEQFSGFTVSEVYRQLDKKERCQAFENALDNLNKLELITQEG